ncbi:penicillin-binding transpeptidase domain-containing protein [Chondromyces crocatus]|uniref:Beta-lactamase n=1 Tax=Chondromyces crocatus TaxID=52 RepID=A0A0K1EEL9_CHOCO|nr:penicillin-binding transpeptidase domain-containing protein [Chondromyces crocatus]AKT39316.1 uncharacterized protein CMC5_034630 [Chondromyces crocatus]
MRPSLRALPLLGLLACAPTAPPAPPAEAPPAQPTSAPPALSAAEAPALPPVADEEVDLSRFLAPLELRGTFVVRHLRTGRTLRHNPERARTRFTPASTFKIPNSLIALETGVVTGEDFALPWKRESDPPRDWWPKAFYKDQQTLRSAFRHSIVWYYRELARRIGPERMKQHLATFAYGNQDMSSGVDDFWLTGALTISAEEQIQFLQRLYEGKLGVSAHATDTLKRIMLLEETSSYRLSGKSGTDTSVPGNDLGWFVGFLERGDDAYVYAFNASGARIWKEFPPPKRAVLVRDMLKSLSLIPADAPVLPDPTP